MRVVSLMQRNLNAFFVLMVMLLLSACGGSGGSDSPSSSPMPLGYAVKGPVSNANIAVYSLNEDGSRGADILATTTTDSAGGYNLVLLPAPAREQATITQVFTT